MMAVLRVLTLVAVALYPFSPPRLPPGILFVLRIGDGVGASSVAAAPVFLDEYTPAGALVQSIAPPTAAVSGSSRRRVVRLGYLGGLPFPFDGLVLPGFGRIRCQYRYGCNCGTLGERDDQPGDRTDRRLGKHRYLDSSDGNSALASNPRSAAATHGTAFWDGRWRRWVATHS